MLKIIDMVKALVAAIIIMVLNVAISFVVVAVYSYVINPGQEEAFYEAIAFDHLIPWSAVVAGLLLFLAAGYLFARRRPERNGMVFAAAIWVGYVLVEFIMIGGADGLSGALGLLGISLGTKLVAGIAGAKLAEK